MKKHGSTIFLIFALLVGLSLLLYPTVSDYWNTMHSTRAIAAYADDVAALDGEIYREYWEQAEEYNRRLLERENPYLVTEEQRQTYESLLDLSGTGIMGYIEIPSLGCLLPIYHGTEEKVLQIAVGHLDWTSLPVGGESTHCVLSGHRGLPSAKLFTDLDQLIEGDRFCLQILDETLTYEVDQILIVEPDETAALLIEEGQDYCTLVTCTPYGVNSHRLLVRGHRVENETETVTIRVTADALQVDPIIVASVLAVPLLLILVIWVCVGDGIRRKMKH